MGKTKNYGSVIKKVGFGLVALAIFSFILKVSAKVIDGEGLDYYLTGQGVPFNYIGALITIVVIIFILLIRVILRFKVTRNQKHL